MTISLSVVWPTGCSWQCKHLGEGLVQCPCLREGEASSGVIRYGICKCLIIVTIVLILFCCNVPCTFLGVRTPILEEHGSAMVLSGRALISMYRLSIVAMLLTEAVWSQFTMQVFGVQSLLPFEGNNGVLAGLTL